MPHDLASVLQPELRRINDNGAVMRCLWIARYIPYPMDAGAKVYSAKLAESLAQAGAAVRFLGFGSLDGVPPVAASPAVTSVGTAGMQWVAVPNAKRSEVLALFSRLPNGAAIDATASYQALLDEQLREHWDAIVLDGYGAGWALARCLEQGALARKRRAVLVHVSHNHEERLWRSMAQRAKTSIPRRLVLWQNYLKVRALERRIARSVDLLTTITDEDRETLARHSTDGHSTAARAITLTPGYAGSAAGKRIIDNDTPRHVIIVGSFRWVMKQENLSRFVELGDPVFAQHNIQLDVVGDVPEPLLTRLQARSRATKFHGFVEDLAPLLSRARMAIVPELIGGGFKLKFLDYIFARVPVATLSEATAGLPDSLRQQTLSRDDLPALVEAIVASIDQTEVLNRMQQRAIEIGEELFRWEDRGLQLLQAISQVRHERQAKLQTVGLKRVGGSDLSP